MLGPAPNTTSSDVVGNAPPAQLSSALAWCGPVHTVPAAKSVTVPVPAATVNAAVNGAPATSAVAVIVPVPLQVIAAK